MDCNYIIVQAGGKGTRLESLTRNKPKALVPVNNLPMIFHLFRKFPHKQYVIIGDYQYEVLKNYLREFAEVEYTLVSGSGHNGTCAGLQNALSFIPENERFMLIWCDLVLSSEYEIPETNGNVIGVSKDFPCRWKYENGVFAEERSQEHGVAGHFIFRNKAELEKVPTEGEFVRWLRDTPSIVFEEQPLYKTREYGIFSEWQKTEGIRCRPFNQVKIEDGIFYKIPVDSQGRSLAQREENWYKKLSDRHFPNLPNIYSYSPLGMELIDGKNVYEYDTVPMEQKRQILKQIILCLQSVHNIGSVPSNRESFYEAYIGKTFDRLKKVRYLVPFANDELVRVNGKMCHNIFYVRDTVERLVMKYYPETFSFIHGDCTFSNIMLRSDLSPVLIDPRGYFGNTELYGDVAYDWVKLYYSLFSNYDQFNLRRFDLRIEKDGVALRIQSNRWEEMEDYFFELLHDEVSKEQMRLLLSITWLSLTTYAWEDYDSVCGAFYNGLYYLEDVLS